MTEPNRTEPNRTEPNRTEPNRTEPNHYLYGYKNCSDSIVRVLIPQTVKVRKYEVDTKGLCLLLRSHKNMSNKQIAEKLNVPITMVEHWFRTDKYFSIPEPDLWMDLKKLLNITDDSFDKQVMEFEEKVGVFESAERVYMLNGISPTITIQEGSIKILCKE